MRRSMLAGVVVAVVALAVMAAVLFVLPGNDDDGTAADGQDEALGSAAADGDGDDGNDSETGEDGGTDAGGQDGAEPSTPPVSGPTTTVAGTPTTIEITTDTVEDDSTDPESDDDEAVDDPEPEPDPDSDDTVPTIPPDTDGPCRLALADLDGQSGVVDLAATGTCAAVGVVVQPVNPRDDLADLRWGRDIEICQRHPAAEAIAVQADTGAGAVDLAGGLSRDPATDDPIEAIVITFADQDSPITGPRPIVICRTAAAELSIVHQPVG